MPLGFKNAYSGRRGEHLMVILYCSYKNFPLLETRRTDRHFLATAYQSTCAVTIIDGKRTDFEVCIGDLVSFSLFVVVLAFPSPWVTPNHLTSLALADNIFLHL